MILEVRMSDDGRIAALFKELLSVTKKPWLTFGWREESNITAWHLTDSEVEDWKVLYRKED